MPAAIDAYDAGVKDILIIEKVGLVATPDNEALGITAINAGGKILYIKARRDVVFDIGGWAGNKTMAKNYQLVADADFEIGIDPASLAVDVDEDGAGVLAAQATGADTIFMG